MGLLDRISRRGSVQATLQYDNSVLVESTYSGEKVTVESAFDLVPVWAAVQLVAGAVASLPLRVFKTNPDGTKAMAPNHRAAKLLSQPNPLMATDEFLETIMSHLLLWGNCFILKEKDASGKVIELWPIPPSRVAVERDKHGFPIYVVDGKSGPFDERTFLHIRGMSFDGLVGLSPIQRARQGLGTYAAVERYAGKFWKNNATPGGVLTHPSRLTPEAAQRLKAQWNASHAGGDNASRVAILEEGMKFEPMSMPLEDAQLIQQLDLSTLNVARLFQVPAHMMQVSNGSSMTYTSTEMEYAHFVRFALRRWLTRIENSLLRDNDIFLANGLGASYSCSFDTSDLTRGDNKTIADINVSLFREGIVTRDEVRAELGRNPLDGGDAPTPADPEVPPVAPETPPVA